MQEIAALNRVTRAKDPLSEANYHKLKSALERLLTRTRQIV